jgi:CheY-like chemotaxis protein
MSQLTNVLLIEDDEVDIMNVQRAFKKNIVNYPLYIARNGIEGLEMLEGNGELKLTTLPIILLDLNMPKMGGIEFLTILRQDPKLKPITVFVLTTSNEESDKVKAYNLNVAGFILKPLSFESFIDSVSILNKFWHLCEQPVLQPYKSTV